MEQGPEQYREQAHRLCRVEMMNKEIKAENAQTVIMLNKLDQSQEGKYHISFYFVWAHTVMCKYV